VSEATEMQLAAPAAGHPSGAADKSIGRIVSVTGSKAIVLLDNPADGQIR